MRPLRCWLGHDDVELGTVRVEDGRLFSSSVTTYRVVMCNKCKRQSPEPSFVDYLFARSAMPNPFRPIYLSRLIAAPAKT